MRASRGDVEDPRPSDAMDDAQADLDTPLLESVTPEEAVAADVRTARPSSMLHSSVLYSCHPV